MGPHRLDRALRVAGDHALGDRPVLEHGLARPARAGEAEVADAVELGLRLLDDVPGVGVARDPGEHRVHGLVGPDVGLAIAAALRELELAQVAHQLGALGVVDPLGGQLHDPALERLANEVGIAHGLHVDARHVGPHLGHDVEKAVLGQPLEGLAHRRAAHAVLLGDPGLGQPRPRLQRDRDDLAAQVGIDLRNRNATAARRAGLARVVARMDGHGELVY